MISLRNLEPFETTSNFRILENKEQSTIQISPNKIGFLISGRPAIQNKTTKTTAFWTPQCGLRVIMLYIFLT